MIDTRDKVEDILQSLKDGELPEDVQNLLAKGLFPLDPNVLLKVLVLFMAGENKTRKEDAQKTANAIPSRILHRCLESPDLSGDELDVLADYIASTPALDRIIRHKSILAQTIGRVAGRVPASLQEVIITNTNRIIGHPEILDSLETNPNLDSAVKRRIAEIRRDFFDVQETVEEPVAEEAPAAGEEALGDLEGLPEFDDMFEIPQEIFDTFGMESLPEDELFSDLMMTEDDFDEEDDQTLYQRVLKMTVPQKIEIALKGNKEARGILIRDANKLVKAAVVMSPKVTESEIFLICGMRDVPGEILRKISTKREWIRKYPVVRQIVFNPHTPVGVSLGFLPRMSDRDLKDLTSDKDVADPVRQAARRLRQTRQSNR